MLVSPRNPRAIAEAVEKVKKGQYKETPENSFPWKNTISLYEKEYKALRRRT